ncbi:MAG: hypothetical protein WC121_14175 [Candidatus Kapaibacterium sp.]
MKNYELDKAKLEIEELLLVVDCSELTPRAIKATLKKDEHLHALTAREIQSHLKEKYSIMTIGKVMKQKGFYLFRAKFNGIQSRRFILRFNNRKGGVVANSPLKGGGFY